MLILHVHIIVLIYKSTVRLDALGSYIKERKYRFRNKLTYFVDNVRRIPSVLCSFQIMIEISEDRKHTIYTTQAVKSKFRPIAMVGSDVDLKTSILLLLQCILEYI